MQLISIALQPFPTRGPCSLSFVKTGSKPSAIEHKLNEVVRYHGTRLCLYFGLSKVRIQQLTAGFIVNLKRMVTLTTRRTCLD